MGEKVIRALVLVPVIACLALLPSASRASTSGDLPGETGHSQDGKFLAQKLERNTSLNELIISSGYSISDADVASFLADFMALNPSIKSISSLKKGSLVKIPLRQLKKTSSTVAPAVSEKKKTGEAPGKAVRARKKKVKEPEPVAAVRLDQTVMLQNVQDLFSSLGEQVTVEQEGFRLFQLSEKSDLSFDTGLFPVVDLHNEHILIIDYANRFPEEMKNLIELSWPEYRVISAEGRSDLRELVPLLLRESGYAFYEKGKMISGGSTQIEYYADYLVYGKNGTMSESAVSLISILEKNEYQTPAALVSWFGKRDVNIIELSSQKKHQLERTSNDVASLDIWMSGRDFTEKVIGFLGYPHEVNAQLSPSKRAEIRYNLKADIMVDLGHRRKVIEFSELSTQEIEFARGLGLDIVCIEPFEKKWSILKKITALLSVNRSDTPRRNAEFLTPQGVRYYLQIPGYVVQGLKKRLFLTESGHEIDMLGNVIADGISIVQF